MLPLIDNKIRERTYLLMRTYELLQVDAFTNLPLGGNPCAVIFDTDEMDSATMLAIAK